jgi:hypothetical protein
MQTEHGRLILIKVFKLGEEAQHILVWDIRHFIQVFNYREVLCQRLVVHRGEGEVEHQIRLPPVEKTHHIEQDSVDVLVEQISIETADDLANHLAKEGLKLLIFVYQIELVSF